MRAIYIFLTGLLLVACGKEAQEAAKGKQLGALFLSESTPSPGTELEFFYDPVQQISEEDKLEPFYHFLVDDQHYAADLKVKDSLGGFAGKMKIPDSATAIVFHFRTNNKLDSNGGKGFVQPLYRNGELIDGSLASIGYFYLKFGEMYGIGLEKDSALALVEDNLRSSSLEEDVARSYEEILYTKDQERGEKYINQRIQKVKGKKELGAEDYRTLASFYGLKGQYASADSIRDLATKNYPESSFAKLAYTIEFFKERDLEKKIQLFERYSELVSQEQKDFMLETLVSQIKQKGDFSQAKSFAEKIHSNLVKARVYNGLAQTMIQKEENLEVAEDLAKEAINLVDNLQDKKPEHLTPKQYKRGNQITQQDFRDTYARALFLQGEKEAALAQQELAAEGNAQTEINEHFVEYLVENEEYEKAQSKSAELIRSNISNEKVKTLLGIAYAENENNSVPFEDFLQELEEEAYRNAKVEYRKTMVSQDAPTFNLKDLEGKEVSLESLRGKTVVLDFWATWCYPCIAAFPGMQEAVQKYKNDPNVQFLFISTMEDGTVAEREKKVSEFLQKNNYDFKVLLDETEGASSNQFVTAGKYNVYGIPAKIIIGPEGKIRYKSFGYDGNKEKLVRELDIVIELTQEESGYNNSVSEVKSSPRTAYIQ